MTMSTAPRMTTPPALIEGLIPSTISGNTFEYELMGRTWYRWDWSQDLTSRTDDITLTIRLAHGGGFLWTWTKHLSEMASARACGKAETVLAAAEAAVSYQPETVCYEYLGDVTTWYRNERRWTAAIGGDEAEVFEHDPTPSDPVLAKAGLLVEEGRFCWSRRYEAGKVVLDLFRQPISGRALTLEEAFMACVDAPERLRRACGALVATLRRASREGIQP
jgi:hypothetical protein